VPGATVSQASTFLQNYDQFPNYYAPEVISAQVLSRRGTDTDVAIRFRKKQVLTVVLDTISHVHHGGPDPNHRFSISHMDQVTEQGDTDHGFLWRMDTLWRMEQAPDGVFLECEVLSLTRDIPTGLGWVVGPFTQSVPKESLAFTLQKTKEGLSH
jgi:hypothetical protein